jgi:sec-independent protein translocase protein TatA
MIIAAIAFELFGGKNCPNSVRGLGEGLRGFKDGINGLTDDIKSPGESSVDRRT